MHNCVDMRRRLCVQSTLVRAGVAPAFAHATDSGLAKLISHIELALAEIMVESAVSRDLL